MNIYGLLMLYFVCLGMLSATTMAANINNGKHLHDKNCTNCHDASLYTRKNRSVNDKHRLAVRVKMCSHQLNREWFPEEVHDVIEYLNTTYYKF